MNDKIGEIFFMGVMGLVLAFTISIGFYGWLML
jgi:hypothetical protein